MLNLDARKKIVEAHKNGMTVGNICLLFGAGKTAVYRLLRMEREGNDITPRTHLRGRKSTLSPAQIEEIRVLVLAQPYITLAGIRAHLDLSVGIASISRILRCKLGFRHRNKRYVLSDNLTYF